MRKQKLKGIYVIGFLLLIFSFITPRCLYGQTELDERAVISFDKGLGFFDPDSLFGLNIRFRMQNRAGMTTINGAEFSPSEFEANVRRLRLRFDGFIGKTDFTYYLQLSFSRGDQEWDVNYFPGVVRDAMIFYNVKPNFYFGFGQGKLPGNRQRVISSGSQQFADRSRVNALFTIDRDFGIMSYYSSQIAGLHYNLKGAISTGEGRNISRTNDGLSYTGRIEILPLGEFKKDGDFFEGDLFREKTPKLSLAGGGAYNHKAVKTLGQRGVALPEEQNIGSTFFDMIFKYNGWSVATEYASRNVKDQKIFQTEDQTLFVYTGWGTNVQASYIWPSNFEVAARYTYTEPSANIKDYDNIQQIYTLGISKYLPDHKNKVQVNLSYNDFPQITNAHLVKNFWNIMFQIEMGI
jgi:phosphate-selective porin OprO and OprP